MAPAVLSIWPHQMSTRTAAISSAVICSVELALLLVAAWLDQSLTLANDGVGLFKHPGVFAILIGDVILFTLCAECSRLTSKIGLRTPSENRRLTRRYFRSYLWRNVFEGKRYFLRLFLFGSLVGMLAVTNQSIKLMDAGHSYGHDTFDSTRHIWSFAANRINLVVSWCFVIPMFVAYTLVHIHVVRTLFLRMRAKGLAAFYVTHPDKSGGYAYIGTANTLFALGGVEILHESVLLAYTHSKVELSNVFAMTLAAAIIVFVSIFAIYEVGRTLRVLKTRLKANEYGRSPKHNRNVSLYQLLLNYNVRFSAYTRLSALLIAALRGVSFVPAIYRTWQIIAGF